MKERVLVLLVCLLCAPASHACRPKSWSAEALARAGQTIVLAEIVGHDNEAITLKVFQTLKGKAPGTLLTEPGQIRGWADGCAVVDQPGWKRVHSVGQKWMLVGTIDSRGKFVASAPAYEYIEHQPVWAKFKEEIPLHVRKQSK